MCEVKIITFDDGANFLAARKVTKGETALFNIVRGMVTGANPLPSVEDHYFGQVTDNPTMQPFLLNMMRSKGGESIPVVRQTPEELLEEGFSEKAIVAGLKAARPLNRIA